MHANEDGYIVLFYSAALEALGDAVTPYLMKGPPEPYIFCHNINTTGTFIEMILDGRTSEGKKVEVEIMVPSTMVRMIVSARSNEVFGFGRNKN